MKKSSLRSQTESRFLTITGVLVAMLGVPSFISLMREPPVYKLSSFTEQRGPASLPVESPEGPVKPNVKSMTVATVKVDCDGSTVDQEVSGGYVRVIGSLCDNTEELEVKNESNGFTASVFLTKKKEFTTDFIDLKEGENKLEIQTKTADGKLLSRQITVRKRLPASIKE